MKDQLLWLTASINTKTKDNTKSYTLPFQLTLLKKSSIFPKMLLSVIISYNLCFRKLI